MGMPFTVPVLGKVHVRTGVTLALLAVAVVVFALWRDEPDSPESPDAPPETRGAVGNQDSGHNGRREGGTGVVPAPYEEASGRGLTVVGRVEDTTGAAIPDAPLSVDFHVGESTFGDPHTKASVVADGDGAFSFTLPSGGAWSATVAPRVPGYVADESIMLLRPDRAPEQAVVVLHALDATRSIRVVDASGRAIAGVRLHVEQTDEIRTTDRSGHARVRVSRSFGPLRVRLTHPKSVATTRAVDAWRGDGPQELEFVLAEGYALSGIARDPAGRPVPGVVVRLVSWTVVRAETDDRGQFHLDGLDPNRKSQRLTFRHPDYLPQTVTASPDQAGFPLEITLRRGLDVCGLVLGPDGRPVMGALVTLGHDQLIGRSRRTTDANGWFCVGAPVRGELMLRVSYPGLAPHMRQIRAEADTADLKITLDRGRVLGGRVIDEDGRPIPDAGLSFHLTDPMDLGRWCDADANGNWLVEGLPSGTVQLECFKYGFIPVEKSDVPTGRRNLDIVMIRSGGIEGTVVDASGQPITRFRVALTPSAKPGAARPARPPSAWSLPGRLFEAVGGRFTSGRTPLRPGMAYRIEVSARGYATRVIEPYVPTLRPRNDPVKVILSGGGEVSGRATDQHGRPVDGVVIAPAGAFPDGVVALARGPRTTTDAAGTYTLTGLSTGSVEIEARHPDYAPVRQRVQIVRGRMIYAEDLVMLAAGALQVDVRLGADSDLGDTKVVLEAEGTGKRAEHRLASKSLTLPWLLAGRYRVSLVSSRPELNGLSTTLDIPAGHRRAIAFEPVPPTCDLIGNVTIDGQVPSNEVVTLVISRVNTDGSRTRHASRGSRPDGSFAFRDLEPGRWHIAASFNRNGRRHSGELAVTLEPGHRPVRLALRTQ